MELPAPGPLAFPFLLYAAGPAIGRSDRDDFLSDPSALKPVFIWQERFASVSFQQKDT